MPETSLLRLALFFLRLGLFSFGGPAAHVALLRREVVTRRKWLSESEFLDLWGATNLIPGPNSTEMMIHVGYRMAGTPGMILAGVCFILPATLIVLLIAWGYKSFGRLLALEEVLYTVTPVVLGIIALALWEMGRKTLTTPWLAGISLLTLTGYLFGLHELALLALGGLIVLGARRSPTRLSGLALPVSLPLLPRWLESLPFQVGLISTHAMLGGLFWVFLKVGALLYGSGYVLLAFLQKDLVTRLGWLSEQQLLDAITIGQVTPGPVFTTATFIGYILAGWQGGIIATIAIFLPSFLYVGLTAPLIAQLRRNRWLSDLIDGVNVASLGLMAGVCLLLARSAIRDWLSLTLFLLSLALLVRTKFSSLWWIGAAFLLGVLRLWWIS